MPSRLNKYIVTKQNNMATQTLEQQLKELQKTVKSMDPKHYKLQSEYHRLMYSYYLQIETIEKAIGKK